MRHDLPVGTVTFLFTDIEGSTALLHELGSERYGELLAQHHRVCRAAWTTHGGVEVDTTGDAFFVAFATPSAALDAAADAQNVLRELGLRVRMGVHTGEASVEETGYVGLEVHRAARIAAAGYGGQVVVSSSTAALVPVEGLVDLGQHRFKDLASPERVFQLGGGEFPPLKSLYRSNLPVPVTGFVGRERELDEVVGLLARDRTRLVTVTGPGGTGKTRLALQAAAEASDWFPDGVFWVPLAGLRDPALAASAVAQAVEVAEQPGRELLDVVVERLAGKRMLVLVDNAEHLLPGLASDLARLRDASPALTLLVTSRERLRLTGEHAYAVPALAEKDSIQLFVERAAAAGAHLNETPAVRQLCARLDHLPLALELAAARVSLFGPEALLARLSQRLDLLRGMRDADPRQQTLRATIEWSHQLLDNDERTLFRRLAVFVGGCTYEAAQAVCGIDPDVFQSLLDKSLLRRHGEDGDADGARYWMLETVREFAQELLPEEERSRLEWGLAEYLASAFDNPTAHVDYNYSTLERLTAELPNIRVALDYALSQQQEKDLASRLYLGAFTVWLVRGPASEGDAWGRRLLREPSGDARLRAMIQTVAGEFARARGEFERAAELKRSAIAALEPLGDDPLLAATHTDLGYVLYGLGEHSEAFRHARTAIAIRQRIGDPGGVAHALHGLAELQKSDGRLDEALEAFEDVLRLHEEAGSEFVAVWALGGLGDAARRMGQGERAEAALLRALTYGQDYEDKWTITFVIGHLGQLELDRGHVDKAGLLLATSAMLIERHEVYVDPGFVEEIRAALASVRAHLDDDHLAHIESTATRAVAAERPSDVLGLAEVT